MAKSLLKMALEGEIVEVQKEDQDPTIVMSGPLSEIFTKALDVAYAKTPVEGTAVVATESQAQDVTVMQKIVESINNNAAQVAEPVDAGGVMPTSGADLQVYGVAKADIKDSDVVDVADALMNEDTETKPKEFVVVVDSTIPGVNGPGSAPQEEVEYLSEAMEALTVKLGGKFYHSFEEFVVKTVEGEDANCGADGTGNPGNLENQGGNQNSEGVAGDPATNPNPRDPSITASVVDLVRMAREEAAPAVETPAPAENTPPEGDATGIAPSLENDAASLPNDPGKLTPEGKEAIGAGDAPIPAPDKAGEVEPAQSVAGDPTTEIAGNAVAEECFRVRVVTINPRQRTRR